MIVSQRRIWLHLALGVACVVAWALALLPLTLAVVHLLED